MNTPMVGTEGISSLMGRIYRELTRISRENDEINYWTVQAIESLLDIGPRGENGRAHIKDHEQEWSVPSGFVQLHTV